MTLHTRIELTQEMMERFLDDIYQGDVSGFSAHKGLPDHLIYNLVCGRIHSLSAVEYRIFTGTTKTVKAKYEWLARKTTQARFSKDPSAGGGDAAFQRKKPETAGMGKGSEAHQLGAGEFSRGLPMKWSPTGRSPWHLCCGATRRSSSPPSPRLGRTPAFLRGQETAASCGGG